MARFRILGFAATGGWWAFLEILGLRFCQWQLEEKKEKKRHTSPGDLAQAIDHAKVGDLYGRVVPYEKVALRGVFLVEARKGREDGGEKRPRHPVRSNRARFCGEGGGNCPIPHHRRLEPVLP